MQLKKYSLVICLVLVIAISSFANVWKVAGDYTFPPFTFTDDKGNYIGYEIDLTKALAKEMGVEVKLINAAWSGLIPGLNNGNYDSLITAMTITEEREQAVEFSDPYLKVGLVVVNKPNRNDVNKLEDLQGKTLAVQIGSTGDITASNMKGVKKVLRFETSPEAFQAVINGAADAAVMDGPVARYFIKTTPGLLKVAIPEFTEEIYGVVIKKGNKDLLNKVNAAIKNLQENGTLDAIYNNWFAN